MDYENKIFMNEFCGLVNNSWKSTSMRNPKSLSAIWIMKIKYSWMNFVDQITARNLKSPSLMHCRIASLLKSLILVMIRWWFSKQTMREVRKWKSRANLESPLQKTASTDLISHENRIAGKSADTAWKKSLIQLIFFLGNIKDEHWYQQ